MTKLDHDFVYECTAIEIMKENHYKPDVSQKNCRPTISIFPQSDVMIWKPHGLGKTQDATIDF